MSVPTFIKHGGGGSGQTSKFQHRQIKPGNDAAQFARGLKYLDLQK